MLSSRKKRVALIAQGGGQKGVFSAGVLDSFQQARFDPFELYIGTSAGALNLCAYILRNEGFAQEFIARYTTNKKFFNLLQYVKNKQGMDLDWAFDAAGITDATHGYSEKAQATLKNRFAYASATNSRTLESHFFRLFEENWLEVLKASCAVPFLSPSKIKIKKDHYIDGGVSAAIPVREAFNRGADVIVVLRTEPALPPQSASFFSGFESPLSPAFSRFNIDTHLDKLSAFQRQLSQRFQDLNVRYANNASRLDWGRFKKMFPDGFYQNAWSGFVGGEFLYRLQMPLEQRLSADMFEMISKHLETYQNAIDFMAQPPARIALFQISPPQYLLSHPLLSKPHHLDQDYQSGILAGKLFLAEYADVLNEISTSPSPSSY